MCELNDIDAAILRCIKTNEPISLKAIEASLPNISAIEFRVKAMCSTGHYTSAKATDNLHFYVEQVFKTTRDKYGCLKQEPIDAYRLTALGQKVLQDYDFSTRRKRRELWLKSVWLPILVTLATNLAISGIKWLLPQIQEWLFHIH